MLTLLCEKYYPEKLIKVSERNAFKLLLLFKCNDKCLLFPVPKLSFGYFVEILSLG